MILKGQNGLNRFHTRAEARPGQKLQKVAKNPSEITELRRTHNHGGLHNAQGLAAVQEPSGWQRHLLHSSGIVVARKVMEMRWPSSE